MVTQLVGVIQESQEAALRLKADGLSKEIIGAGIEVHRRLGPGLLEFAYEECLCCELGLRGIEFKRQLPLPVISKGQKLDCGYRLDMLVEDPVIIEVKAIEEIAPIHEAQLLTYLRLRNSWLGLIMNFNVLMLKDGIRRLVNG